MKIPPRVRTRLALLFLLANLALFGLIALEAGWLDAALGREDWSPPNVVIISIDSLNAAHLGYNGYPRDTSPNLDAFAAHSVNFVNAISPAGWTVPSYASLFTGQYQNTHNVDRPGDRLPDSALTFTEILKAFDYNTAMFTEMGYVTEDLGVDQGFRQYIRETERFNPMRYRQAARWINEYDSPRPFFLFFYTNDVHFPYIAVPPERNPFIGDAHFADIAPLPVRPRQLAPPVLREEANHGIEEYGLLFGEYTERDTLGLYVAQYDASVWWTDRWLGVILNALAGKGLLENTVVIITADHGESLIDNDRYFAHSSFFESILKVPFLIHVPGVEPRTVESQIQLVDVAPTILHLARIRPPETMTGISFLPLLRGETESVRDFAYAFGDVWGVVRTNEWKLVKGIIGKNVDLPNPWLRLARDYLFDLRHDPRENNNLLPTENPRVQRKADELERQLYDFMDDVRSVDAKYIPDTGDIGEEEFRAFREQIAPVEHTFDSETLKRLRDLGYLR